MVGRDDNPEVKRAGNNKKKTSSANSKSNEQHKLSSGDHNILEATIRGRVAKRVNLAHKDDKSKVLPIFNPDTDETALKLPGVDIARKYRDDLAKALVNADPTHHREVIDKLVAERIPIQTASIHLFAPVATQLGELWCEDAVDFIQVAVATSRLSLIVNQLVTKNKENYVEQKKTGRKILLARTHGGNHTLGLAIVAACFDDAGWEVDGGSDFEADDGLLRQIGREPYQMMGLSVSTTAAVQECSMVIQRTKRVSKNRDLKIAIGGPAVIMDKTVFYSLGADIIATTALDAVAKAQELFAN